MESRTGSWPLPGASVNLAEPRPWFLGWEAGYGEAEGTRVVSTQSQARECAPPGEKRGWRRRESRHVAARVDRAGPFFLGKGRRERPWGKGRLAFLVQYCHQAEFFSGRVSPALRLPEWPGPGGMWESRAGRATSDGPLPPGDLRGSRDRQRDTGRGPATLRVQHREAKARDPGGRHVWAGLEGWKPPGRRGEGAPSRVRGARPLAHPALDGRPAPSPRSWSRIGLGGAPGPRAQGPRKPR